MREHKATYYTEIVDFFSFLMVVVKMIKGNLPPKSYEQKKSVKLSTTCRTRHCDLELYLPGNISDGLRKLLQNVKNP